MMHKTSTKRLTGTRRIRTQAASVPLHPPASETARTIIDIVREGTLCTVSPNGVPIGSPVSYKIDKSGSPWLAIQKGSIEALNLASNRKCSLMVQPSSLPARAVASVTLLGSLDISSAEEQGVRLELEQALYFGGLDEVSP